MKTSGFLRQFSPKSRFSLGLLYLPVSQSANRKHFPAVVRIHMTTYDPTIIYSMMFLMQSRIGWPTHVPCWLDMNFRSNHWQTVTADEHILASMQCMYQTHSCSTSGEVKLLSCLISSELGCKVPYLNNSTERHQPSCDPLSVQ